MGNNQPSITIKISFVGKVKEMICFNNYTIKEIIEKYIKDFLNSDYEINKFYLEINGKICDLNENLESYKNDIINNCIFNLSYFEFLEDETDFNGINLKEENIKKECFTKGQDDSSTNESSHIDNTNNFDMEIDIKFFKIDKNKFNGKNNIDLHGLLKLCLLKEIAITDEFTYFTGLPKEISNIITILKNGKIEYNEVKEGILEILKKIKGGNIINFSNYVDSLINQKDINKYLIPKLNYSKNQIAYIQNCLGKYVEYSKRFEEEFERAKKKSVFEYSIISATIIEREDIDKFDKNREDCPNRVDRVLFHGTCYGAISEILTDMFNISKYSAQHGEGVYFTEDLDSCWIYGSQEKSNNKDTSERRNLDIPKVGQYLSFIASAVYYNDKKKKRVYNSEYTPGKNEMNYAFAGMKYLETITTPEPDKSKFYGTEFVINDTNQICPFMSFKLKRDEYCIIWRDNNFSKNPVYNNEFDSVFKQFLKERMEYINKMAKFNVYACETSEEALILIKRKKYNKIILISNIGSDKAGKTFIENARKIIGSDVVVLFNAYSIYHLDWVKDFPNAFFSNEPKFYEDYLDCFYGKNEKECKSSLLKLKKNIEEYYNVAFKFDDKFLYYPHFEDKNIKQFLDLTF